nr:DUF6273 domain-containing protein [Acholeplasmatales bacterium]
NENINKMLDTFIKSIVVKNSKYSKYKICDNKKIIENLNNKNTKKVTQKDKPQKTKVDNNIKKEVEANPIIEYNKYIFGSYPQTLVKDNAIIEKLNKLAGKLPSKHTSRSWINYNYYAKSKIENYMWYKDITYNNKKYRGVYFKKYRPRYCSYKSSSTFSKQNDNGYSTNTIYWFSYDPIEWDILEQSHGKALIIANLILDSQEYYPYANNYELSSIRKWLNDNFYNTAFNDLQKNSIEATEVDNSASSTGDSSNPYVCNNTKDKIFLLSCKEVTTYYNSDSKRQAKGTDYAKCQNLKVSYESSTLGNSYWWLRSPYHTYSFGAYKIEWDGGIDFTNVSYTSCGIRPACYINY